MDREAFNQHCSEYPHTTHVVQWGNADVWKVNGKVFAIGTLGKDGRAAYTFKTSPLNFEFLSHHDGYIPAPYMASRGMKWIQQVQTDGRLDEELTYYVNESFRLVVQGFSKKRQKELGLSAYYSD